MSIESIEETDATQADGGIDVAVVGAGLSGLTCGRWLHEQGYRTLVLEKSRGLGGRIATRRVEDVPLDHGARYLVEEGIHTQRLIQQMSAEGIVSSSAASVVSQGSDSPHQVYVAPQGMTAIAKALAADLTVYRQHRVEGMERQADRWCLQVMALGQPKTITARAVVLALPAPQVVALLRSQESGLAQLVRAAEAVAFDPCFSVMAGYAAAPSADLPLGLLIDETGHDLSWIGFEQRKRPMAHCRVVLQSSAEFAAQAIDRLAPAQIAERLVQASQAIQPVAALGQPEWTQTHRWRYAFCRRPHPEPCLSGQTPLPLVCCGDWCGGSTLESAARSGLAAAEAIASAF